ncbi:mechanosensitive ion channel family protein [Halorientalis pallida]|uniref:Mechanosensitive ion channel family protein n=1 Tax=Halorientalis pallida TaxID=2479928 RepID=A0A498KR52_9EURY|nr:mechanosensitive ion channel family protein [Halorientalis pallida]RXK46709.1 mechanosensitive ion channel family protein [Halorientalis pallida]
MTLAGAVVDTIQNVLDTRTLRILATILIVGAWAALSITVKQMGPVLHDRLSLNKPLVEGAQAALVIVVTVAAGALVTIIWRASDEAAGVLALVQADPRSLVRLFITLLLFVFAYALTVLVKRIMKDLSEQRSAISIHQREVGYHLAQVSVYLFAILGAFSIWGVDLSNLLLGAGFLGVVVGLAARQTLAAVLAGFVLLFSRPFDVGDWVVVSEREGIVTDVTIFNTEIKTPEDEYVLIPNDIVTSNAVVNRSRAGRLRVDVEVGVDYEADPKHAASVAQDAMTELDEVLEKPDPLVVLREFGDSAVVLECRFWIDDPSARREWQIRSSVVEAVKTAFDREGIKIPFPQRELMGREEASGLKLAGGERAALSADGDVDDGETASGSGRASPDGDEPPEAETDGESPEVDES